VQSFPAGERGWEKLQLDGTCQAASVSHMRQVIALQRDRVLGHYARSHRLITVSFPELRRIQSIVYFSNNAWNRGWSRSGSHMGSRRRS